mmetsp:Transcript_4210/g.12175  ORF Transcript_4210/g.12175 Transcript_4210/m.12175 type:complete len:249 (+) Transcript_4210:544-1290(+)
MGPRNAMYTTRTLTGASMNGSQRPAWAKRSMSPKPETDAGEANGAPRPRSTMEPVGRSWRAPGSLHGSVPNQSTRTSTRSPRFATLSASNSASTRSTVGTTRRTRASSARQASCISASGRSSTLTIPKATSVSSPRPRRVRNRRDARSTTTLSGASASLSLMGQSRCYLGKISASSANSSSSTRPCRMTQRRSSSMSCTRWTGKAITRWATSARRRNPRSSTTWRVLSLFRHISAKATASLSLASPTK